MNYISLFSGIEAATVAWMPLGWDALAFAEIDPFPCAVLAERFPDVPNLGDVSTVDWSPYHGRTDVVVGGSPCQAFSVAGRRAGLDDPRGQLMLEYVRAVRDIGPRWVVWENVPGVLSQDGGRAFSTLLGELAECGYSLCWRVLDAQFFGVAQRRRRVFLVGGPTAGSAAAVLFEPGSVPGGSGESKAQREALARTAGERSSRESVGCLTPGEYQSLRIYGADGAAPTLQSRPDGTGTNTPAVAYEGCLTPGEHQSQCIWGVDGSALTLPSRSEHSGDHTPTIAFKPNKAATSGTPSIGDNQSPTLMGDTHQPAVAFKPDKAATSGSQSVTVEQSPSLMASHHAPAVAFPWAQGGNVHDARPSDDVSPTIGAHPYNAPAVAFAQNTRDELRLVNGDGQIAGALAAQQGMKQQTYVAISQYGDVAGTLTARHDSSPCADRGQSIVCMTDTQPHAMIDGNLCGALSATMHKDPPVVCDADDWVVRRLTPLECERLQGFPDNWTAIPGAKDGPRYKAIGNSMAVPVMRWIGERIALVDSLLGRP